jgi:hypothetical protein
LSWIQDRLGNCSKEDGENEKGRREKKEKEREKKSKASQLLVTIQNRNHLKRQDPTTQRPKDRGVGRYLAVLALLVTIKGSVQLVARNTK